MFGIVLGFALADGLAAGCPPLMPPSGSALLLTRYSSLGGHRRRRSSRRSPRRCSGRFDLALLFLGFALLVFWKHRENIGRLLAGTEPRVGRSDG